MRDVIVWKIASLILRLASKEYQVNLAFCHMLGMAEMERIKNESL